MNREDPALHIHIRHRGHTHKVAVKVRRYRLIYLGVLLLVSIIVFKDVTGTIGLLAVLDMEIGS